MSEKLSAAPARIAPDCDRSRQRGALARCHERNRASLSLFNKQGQFNHRKEKIHVRVVGFACCASCSPKQVVIACALVAWHGFARLALAIAHRRPDPGTAAAAAPFFTRVLASFILLIPVLLVLVVVVAPGRGTRRNVAARGRCAAAAAVAYPLMAALLLALLVTLGSPGPLVLLVLLVLFVLLSDWVRRHRRSGSGRGR